MKSVSKSDTSQPLKVVTIRLDEMYDDIHSVEYKGIKYINVNYNEDKHGRELFSFSM